MWGDKKGFSYTIEDEKLIEYMKLSTEDKLNWLEEINEFMNMVLNDREKEIREKLRKGEI
ncbi:MAG: hypothetical protein CVT89_00670 [Candidatus Altiarchaeales archaeon HGW-Altiarchaeales-2]|nr:MAG: hypothetical protein CVT89_00670 [Candidatus Altiarchaeales archaeon HGW-Altiarchaeales-2]